MLALEAQHARTIHVAQDVQATVAASMWSLASEWGKRSGELAASAGPDWCDAAAGRPLTLCVLDPLVPHARNLERLRRVLGKRPQDDVK